MTSEFKRLFHELAKLQRRASHLSLQRPTDKEGRIMWKTDLEILIMDLRALADEMEAHT